MWNRQQHNPRYLGVRFVICPLWMNGWVRVNGPWVLAGCQAGRLGKMISPLSLWSSLSLAIIIVINITMNGGVSMNEWMNELRQMQVPIIGSRPRWLGKGWLHTHSCREESSSSSRLVHCQFIIWKKYHIWFAETLFSFWQWKWGGPLLKPPWLRIPNNSPIYNLNI